MKSIKAVFEAKLTRYNFHSPIFSIKKEYDIYPTENDLLDFLNECNKKDRGYKDYRTTISVDKIYQVINVS